MALHYKAPTITPIDLRGKTLRWCRCRHVGCKLYLRRVPVVCDNGTPWKGAQCGECTGRLQVMQTLTT